MCVCVWQLHQCRRAVTDFSAITASALATSLYATAILTALTRPMNRRIAVNISSVSTAFSTVCFVQS